MLRRKTEGVNRGKSLLLASVALMAVLGLNGALPGVAAPTTLQAGWTVGFSQSFVNESLLAIHAKNIGAPHPAAISFGLAAAYPAGWLIATGLPPGDAYSGIAALWLTLAFYGAWQLSRLFGCKPFLATVSAVLWLSMPITWGHAGYSMVSLGMALLPFYLWTAFRVFIVQRPETHGSALAATNYFAACLVAVFMDGYSFVMFAVGASVLLGYCLLRSRENRRYRIRFALPVHAISFGAAYTVYAMYVGRTEFEPMSFDWFRSFGVDLSFLVVPTRGVHWLWDALGWSAHRSDKRFFGDSSVWSTTFSLPVLIASWISWWCCRKRFALATGLLLVNLFGIYMALGPVLKVNFVKPEAMAEKRLMPAELAVPATGSAWISQHVPGFKNMRAAYRWTALGVFGSWALLAMFVGSAEKKGRRVGVAVVCLIVVSNLPDPKTKWAEIVRNREWFQRVDTDLLGDLRPVLPKGGLVAFLPYRNDFVITYLAPQLGIRAYNIGGDKNLTEARRHWPATMQSFRQDKIDPGFARRILLLLARHEADSVVLPYANMLEAGFGWPAPLRDKDAISSVVAELRASETVTVDERRYFAIVKPFRRKDLDPAPVN